MNLPQEIIERILRYLPDNTDHCRFIDIFAVVKGQRWTDEMETMRKKKYLRNLEWRLTKVNVRLVRDIDNSVKIIEELKSFLSKCTCDSPYCFVIFLVFLDFKKAAYYDKWFLQRCRKGKKVSIKIKVPLKRLNNW